MAYNPFNVFRRNQKAIFAVVTVIIMFTFVLSSGLGGGADFFDFFPQWLAGKTRKGEVVATLNGSKVYAGELEAIRKQRHLANKYMALASEVTQLQLRQFIADRRSKMSPEGRMTIDSVLNLPQMMQFFQGNPAQAEKFVRDSMGRLRELASDKSKAEDREAANAFLAVTELEGRRSSPTGGGEHYFVNLGNQTQREAIDFMLWEKKADQLGISFTTADVKALIRKEFMQQFVDDSRVREIMTRDGQGRFSMEECLKAIAAEFRVRAAQTAVIGPILERPDRTLTAAPIYSPPFEVFEFYREQCSPSTYQVLAVPAANFTGLITETPSEDDLKRLFNQYKDQEPNPANEQPGFREPRKIKVEWLSAKGDEPFYKSAAKEWLDKSQLAAYLGAGLTTSPLDAVAMAPLGLNTNALLESNYETQTVRGHRSVLMFDWGATAILPKMLDTSVVRPENLAAAAGSAAGAVAGFGMNFGPAAMLATRATAAEHRARIAVGMSSFLGGVPGPGMFGTMMTGEARAQSAVPKPLPIDVVRPELARTLVEKTARKFMVDDFARLNRELNGDDMTKKRDAAAEAKKLLAEFIAKRNLPTGKSADGEPGLRDEWSIAEEAGLAALKEAVEKDGQNPHGGLSAPIQFGNRFFWTQDMRTGARIPTRGNFRTDYYPKAPNEFASPFLKTESTFLVWRTDDVPAKSVSFPVAKAKVEAAWKRIKSREFAKKRAEEIAEAVRKDAPANESAIRMALLDAQGKLRTVTPDPKADARVKFFEMSNVCPLAPVTDFSTASAPGGVRPFSLAPSTNIPYPTSEMARTLIDERTKPVKTTLVLTDAPKDTYYVAVLSGRSEKDLLSFKTSVYAESQTAAARRMVNQAHASDSVRKMQDSIRGLIKKEFKYVETKEQKEKLDENARKGGES